MVAGKFSDGQYESLPSAQSYQTLVSVYKLALSLVSSKTEIWARFSQLGNAVKLFNVLLSSWNTSLKVQFLTASSNYSRFYIFIFLLFRNLSIFLEFQAFRVFQTVRAFEKFEFFMLFVLFKLFERCEVFKKFLPQKFLDFQTFLTASSVAIAVLQVAVMLIVGTLSQF